MTQATIAAERSQPKLIADLMRPDAYTHPAENLRLHETHSSWVVLAGPYAYKLKKPVNLGFLDFTTVERRRDDCEEEVRLNRRFSPDVYLGTVDVTEDRVASTWAEPSGLVNLPSGCVVCQSMACCPSFLCAALLMHAWPDGLDAR